MMFALFSYGCSTQTKIVNQTESPTVVAVDEYADPMIGYNRFMFSVNDSIYRYGLIPVAKGYDWLVPDIAQKGVSNFFYNIKSPIYFVNNLAQGNVKNASINLFRFTVNSTLGLLGLFDPAKDWFDVDKQARYFESTLANYGVGPGYYFVLPILGSSDLRNGPSLIVDFALNPVTYYPDDTERYLINALDFINSQAKTGDKYLTLYDETQDPYIYFRNMYLQGKLRDDQFANN